MDDDHSAGRLAAPHRTTPQPDANDDNLAARFRDECAPKSFTWFYNHWPGDHLRRTLRNGALG